jgi:hypothetical protein
MCDECATFHERGVDEWKRKFWLHFHRMTSTV